MLNVAIRHDSQMHLLMLKGKKTSSETIRSSWRILGSSGFFGLSRLSRLADNKDQIGQTDLHTNAEKGVGSLFLTGSPPVR